MQAAVEQPLRRRSGLQFLQNGCENCSFLAMDGDRSRCEDCTTTYFSGIISIIDPASSWTAKWLHLGACCRLAPRLQGIG